VSDGSGVSVKAGSVNGGRVRGGSVNGGRVSGGSVSGGSVKGGSVSGGRVSVRGIVKDSSGGIRLLLSSGGRVRLSTGRVRLGGMRLSTGRVRLGGMRLSAGSVRLGGMRLSTGRVRLTGSGGIVRLILRGSVIGGMRLEFKIGVRLTTGRETSSESERFNGRGTPREIACDRSTAHPQTKSNKRRRNIEPLIILLQHNSDGKKNREM